MTRAVTLPPFIDYALIIQVAKGVSKHREWASSLSQEQAFEIAYDAINNHVMRGETLGREPSRFLAAVGRRAIRIHLGAQKTPQRAGPKSAKYWAGDRGYTPDPTGEVEERIALHQAMAGLESDQRKDLVALAATFDLWRGARLRGMHRTTFANKCKAARQAFFRLWFEGETPPALPLRVVNRA